MRRRAVFAAWAVVVAAVCGGLLFAGCSSESDASGAKTTAADEHDWSWFVDTYWIVPEDGIYNVVHRPKDNSFTMAKGQTVFHLTDYSTGYFTGAVVVKFGEPLVPLCQFVLGQITPEGAVHMTMYNADDGAVVNFPVGSMEKRDGEWAMVNQMTGGTGATLSHWAFMVQSEAGDPSWDDLPFAHEAIPDFMSACPAGPILRNKP